MKKNLTISLNKISLIATTKNPRSLLPLAKYIRYTHTRIAAKDVVILSASCLFDLKLVKRRGKKKKKKMKKKNEIKKKLTKRKGEGENNW